MGDRLEERIDYTADLKTKIPEATALAKDGKLQEALEILIALERNCRLGNDHNNLKEVVLTLVRLCHECKDWGQLNATATLLAKRRGQQGRTITAMVQECMQYIDDAPSKEIKVDLIVALRDITDGKIFVESERARLTRQLAAIKEADGDIIGATDVLQEVAVETYGALDKKEKAEFILEQIRLTLLKKDFVRALIQSRKISRKVMEGEDMQALKVKFYRLMVDYDLRERDAFAVCNNLHSIYSTAIVKEDPAQWKSALSSAILFMVISPFTNTQQDMMHRVAKYPELEQIPAFETLIRLFTTHEIIGYPLPETEEIEAHLKEVIRTSGEVLGPRGFKEADPVEVAKWIEDLRTRVVQHNIRAAARYYRRIRSPRLAQLLGLSEDETERAVSTMVCDGTLYARINRPASIVNFSKPKPAEEILSSWNSDLGRLLGLVELATHLINKETMLASTQSKA